MCKKEKKKTWVAWKKICMAGEKSLARGYDILYFVIIPCLPVINLNCHTKENVVVETSGAVGENATLQIKIMMM